jgi:MoxR-like ATPase
MVAARDSVQEIIARVGRSVIGQEELVERLVFTLLANGNVLLEGLPGLAKTRAVKSLGKVLAATLSRIQFTPDLLPADITGSDIYDNSDGNGTFRFREGPIFANLVLADEINRAPAKVQSALLEAMEERQVTVAGTTHKMPELFAVMATQNPIEQEGTYPLPEAQMDRFLMHVKVEYPDPKAELAIVDLVRSEELPAEPATGDTPTGDAPIPQQVIFDAREEVHAVFVAPPVAQYIVDIVNATRFAEKYDKKLKSYIQVGASPRGALGLDRCSRVNAWLQGRDHTTPDDVRAVAHDVLRHRLMLSYEASAQGMSPDAVIDQVLKLVAVA